jgi:hypothetical protein
MAGSLPKEYWYPIMLARLIGLSYSQIGSVDPFLDRAVLDVLPGKSVVAAGDRILRDAGDPASMAGSHERFVRSGRR